MKTRVKKSSRLLAIILSLVMICGLLPMSAFAVDVNDPAGSFPLDENTSYFSLTEVISSSTNNNVVPTYVWQYDGDVYIALNCHKNVSVGKLSINGVDVSEYWILPESTALSLYNGDEATTPIESFAPGHNRVWLIGIISLEASTILLDFENESYAGGWSIGGTEYAISGDLNVSHVYGSESAVFDLDQSETAGLNGLTTGERTINKVDKTGYTYSGVTINVDGNPMSSDLYSIDENGQLAFTITDAIKNSAIDIIYIYTATPYDVTYSFESGTTGYELPTAINGYLPADGTAHNGDTVTASAPSQTTYTNSDGTWTFQGWDAESKTVNGEDISFTGTWTLVLEDYDVTYSFESGTTGYDLPTAINDYLPADGTAHNGDTVTASAPSQTTYTNSDGTWTFQGWDAESKTVNGEDISFTGTWTLVLAPSDDPTGTAELIKVDANDQTTYLSGAKFELYRVRGTSEMKIGAYTTNSAGKITRSLDPGNYYWVEVVSPEGYKQDDTKHEFTVTAYKKTSITVTNTRTAVPSVFGDDHYAYIIGYPDGQVHPEGNITRAEVATIFFRLLSDEVRNQYMTTSNNFSDVNEGNWFNRAVSTMAAMGIVNGYPDGTFNPNGYITRGEFAAIAARFDTNGNTTNASFTDIYDHWGQKEINIAANNGWVLGYDDGTFKPNQLITRAEAMTMVNRVLQRIPETKDDLLRNMITWPDNMDTTKWYYLHVQEATNSHDYERKANGYEYWTKLRPVRDWAALEK